MTDTSRVYVEFYGGPVDGASHRVPVGADGRPTHIALVKSTTHQCSYVRAREVHPGHWIYEYASDSVARD